MISLAFLMWFIGVTSNSSKLTAITSNSLILSNCSSLSTVKVKCFKLLHFNKPSGNTLACINQSPYASRWTLLGSPVSLSGYKIADNKPPSLYTWFLTVRQLSLGRRENLRDWKCLTPASSSLSCFKSSTIRV